MARYNNRKRRKNTTLPEVTLTPLIDTVLVLLIIFMISMPVLNTYFSVDLPQAHNGDTQQVSQPVSINIDAHSQYYIDGEHVTYQYIADQTQKALEKAQSRSVVVYADQNLSYGAVMTLLDDLKAIDAYVALAAQPRHT